MSLRWKQVSAAGLAAAAGLLGTLVTAASAEVWLAKGDHEKRITTLEADGKSQKELLIEVRQDVKELLRRAAP